MRLSMFLKIIRFLLLTLTVYIGCLFSLASYADKPRTIDLGTEHGKKLFDESIRGDYSLIANHYQPQNTGTTCGVASAVIAHNLLTKKAAYSYKSFFNFPQGEEFRQQVLKEGMTLKQLANAISQHGLVTEVTHGDALTEESFHKILEKDMADTNNVMLVNYKRTAVGQKGGGHISPIAAYNPAQKKALIYDVRMKYGPVWVSVSQLLEGMKMVDSSSNLSRGYVSVSNPNSVKGNLAQCSGGC